ncbi:hypothetical protein, partial [Escherichia coli]|uniref:hypothetical protein n=1 Tax=Escherichia coli TaxID=562 RepID=UPI001BC9E469
MSDHFILHKSPTLCPVTTAKSIASLSQIGRGSAAWCSCPLISRQGLYLKLTLPADVDILAESDNPTHYADGF